MEEDAFCTAIYNLVYVVGFEYRFAVDDNIVTLDGYHFAGVLINKVFYPCAQYPCCEFSAHSFLEVCSVDLHFVREVEDFQYLLVVFVTDCPEEGGDGELFLTVDIGVHHIIDVRSELYP